VRVTGPGSPAGTNEVLNASAWKRDGASVGTYYDVAYGADNAEGQTQFGESFNEHSFCRPGSPSIEFAVLDSDGDDGMGTISLSASADYSAGVDLGDSRIKFRLTKY